jgi:hypothetical protein
LQVEEKAKSESDLSKRIKELEKITSQRPRRASRSKETELDADSELGKEITKQTFKPPAGMEDMFINGGSS